MWHANEIELTKISFHIQRRNLLSGARNVFPRSQIKSLPCWLKSPKSHGVVQQQFGMAAQSISNCSNTMRDSFQEAEETSYSLGEELILEFIEYSKILHSVLNEVEFFADSSSGSEDLETKRCQLSSAVDTLKFFIFKGQRLENAIEKWRSKRHRIFQEENLQELMRDEKRVKHSLNVALARLAEVSSELDQSRDKPWMNETSVGPSVTNLHVSKELPGEEKYDVSLLGPSAVSLPEYYKCVVSHPGALTCTKANIQKDDHLHSALINMETTVRCSGDACIVAGIEADDFVALGLQEMTRTATDLTSSLFSRTSESDPLVHNTHAHIVDILRDGEVVACSPMDPPSCFGHVSFVVRLRDKKTGEEIEAMVKPKVEGDAEGWHRAPIEWVAYQLNLMLGMDYVPPVYYQTGGVDLNWTHFDEAAFIYWVPNCQQLNTVHPSEWGVSVAHVLSDTRILDVLIANSDRHHGHFFFGDHWMDGKKRPVLIDHAAGFRKDAVVKMHHENAFGTGAITSIAASTYLRLRFLSHEMVQGKFKDFLSEEEISGLMGRREEILNYFDSLVKERGYHRTVIE